MKFNNRENECVESTDGRKFWISRSVAVIIHLVIGSMKELNSSGLLMNVVAVKRGKDSHNFIDHWCLPCGFLDWEESAPQACVREFWEETGINLNDAIKNSKQVIYNGLESGPWKIVTEPELDGMQNICLHYGVCLDYDDLPLVDFSNGETAEVKLQMIQGFIHSGEPIAFNHDERIKDFVKFLETTYEPPDSWRDC